MVSMLLQNFNNHIYHRISARVKKEKNRHIYTELINYTYVVNLVSK